jgi:hypothetical protein
MAMAISGVLAAFMRLYDFSCILTPTDYRWSKFSAR